MTLDGWAIAKDAQGFYAHDPRRPSTVRVIPGSYIFSSSDGGCTIPDKVIATLEGLLYCNCNPLEQTGGVHRRDCPAWQAEWETVT